MKTIKLDHITKIEGHAKLNVKIRNNKVLKADLEIFEGARYFEGIVKGRRYDEVPVLTSRICGICSPIHQLTSTMAVENAFGVKVSKQTKTLRELLCLGGDLQSHVMHLYFLVLPDYLGFGDAIGMAAKYPKEIKTAIRLKKLGNDIVTTIGGRAIHPFASIIGGFSRIPDKKKMKQLLIDLKAHKQDAIDTLKLFQSLKYPKYERETQYFSLDNYTYLFGHITCVGSMCVPTVNYLDHFKEYFVPKSTAKRVLMGGKNYMVGALPRVNNNFDKLHPAAKKLVKVKFPNYSPFMNNVCQAIEVVDNLFKCIDILEKLELKEEKEVKFKVKAGRGIAVCEAPRGLLFHDYTFDAKGYLKVANIITPTVQSLNNIEGDIKDFLPHIMDKPEKEVILNIEKLIRSYDPCISCSTHFLKVNWE